LVKNEWKTKKSDIKRMCTEICKKRAAKKQTSRTSEHLSATRCTEVALVDSARGFAHRAEQQHVPKVHVFHRRGHRQKPLRKLRVGVQRTTPRLGVVHRGRSFAARRLLGDALDDVGRDGRVEAADGAVEVALPDFALGAAEFARKARLGEANLFMDKLPNLAPVVARKRLLRV
jgi:hypothetical protein